jgi:thioesterase domain-containing protein
MQLLDRDSLQAYLTARIAPAHALGLTIVDVEPLTIAAPLAANLNDKGTAFAGSLYSAAALAGWALLTRWCSAESIVAEVALHDSSARFLAPARAAFRAVARAPGHADLAKLKRMLVRAGRGRIELIVEVSCEATRVMTLAGAYAVTLSGVRG